jgi:hypothetical protein
MFCLVAADASDDEVAALCAEVTTLRISATVSGADSLAFLLSVAVSFAA